MTRPASPRRPRDQRSPMTFPRLVLRDEVADLLDLPWERPLGSWGDTGHRFRELPVGPSRHLVRFLVVERDRLRAQGAARTRSPSASTRCCATSRTPGCPSVRAVGLAARPDRGDAILVTEYLRHSMQYRRLLMLLRPGSTGVPRPPARRDGAAARRPPPGRRLLGRLLAREHAVPARRRPDPGLPRRRGDQRGPPGPVRRPARVRPRDPRRERRLRPRRPRRLPGPRGGHGRGDRRRPVRPDALRGGVERAARPARDDPGRPAGHPRAPAAAQRPRLLRRPRGRPGRAARGRSGCGRP